MKKIIALLLLLALLTGCTAAPAATEPTQPATTPTVTEPTVPETVPAETDPSEPRPDGLYVHFIDVGQADCALLECDGQYALIDCGNTEDGPLVIEYLQNLGVERLSLAVGTHPHEDHIGGFASVLHEYDADTVWFSYTPYVNWVVEGFQRAVMMQSKSITKPKVGDTFQLGDATITMLGPVKTSYEDVNDLSLVLMVQYGDTRFLFTGDMEAIAEEDLLNSGADVKADVLKVGHHGSYSSTTYRLLREVAPTYGVICVGGNNEYGHPHDAPMSRLKDAEVTIYRTDKMYDIVAFSDGENITFTWENQYAKPWTPEK